MFAVPLECFRPNVGGTVPIRVPNPPGSMHQNNKLPRHAETPVVRVLTGTA